MGLIPIPEIEAELLVRGVLVRQFLRDPSKPQEGPSLPLGLVDNLPRSRTTTKGLGRWVAKYLTPDAIKSISELPKHLQWEAVRDEFLTNEDLLDLAQRLGIGTPTAELTHKQASDPELYRAWWIAEAKAALRIASA
jgi:hypothetical protein